MNTRQFHLGDILSVTTGVMLSPRNMVGLGELVDFMVGDSVSGLGFSLLIAAESCRQHLFHQHPCLTRIRYPEPAPVDVDAWLAEQQRIYGEGLTISKPIAPSRRSART